MLLSHANSSLVRSEYIAAILTVARHFERSEKSVTVTMRFLSRASFEMTIIVPDEQMCGETSLGKLCKKSFIEFLQMVKKLNE